MTMQKAKEIKDELLNSFDKLEIKRKPKLLSRVDSSLNNETFHTSYAGGTLSVVASSDRVLIFSLQQIMTALLSGHLGEILGKFSPRFSLRPLMLSSQDSVDACCRNAIVLGYNAIIYEGKYDPIFREYGLQVFLKENVKEADGLFFESSLLKPDFYDRDRMVKELVYAEVRELEKTMGKRTLIYFIPTKDEMAAKKHCNWLPDLCDDVGDHTILAFSAVSGEPTFDHLEPHPFWDTLRQAPDVSATRLMPLLNIGSVGQGECLWPALSLDLLQERFERHHFAGVIGITNTVPKEKGYLHLCLWVASMWMWHGRDPKRLAETWCLAYRPNTNLSLLDRVRMIVKDISALRHVEYSREESRVIADSVIAQLDQLKLAFENEDAFTYFDIDARNLLAHVLKS